MTSRAPDKNNIELGLAALTYIAFNWEHDRDVAKANLEPLLETYSMPELYEGAMHALAVISIRQAQAAGMSVVEYMDTLRPLVDYHLAGDSPA